MAFIQQIQAFASRLLPAPAADGTVVNLRASRYGDISAQAIITKKHVLADEGTYFVSTNPTPGTAIAGPIISAFSATGPWFIFQNNNPVGGPRAYLDYLKIIVSIAAASGSTFYMSAIRDQISRALTSDNTTTATPVNVNGDSGVQSKCIFKYCATTINVAAAATPQAAVVARASMGGLTIPGDEIVMDFGATDPSPYPGLTAVQAVAGGRKVSICPPVIVAPQQQVLFNMWEVGNSGTGLSYEFELGHWER
jgi:hypothetical protein